MTNGERDGSMRARRQRDGLEAVRILLTESDPEVAARMEREFRHFANDVTLLRDRQEVEDFAAGRGEWEDDRRLPDVLVVDVDMLGPHCRHTMRRIRQRADATGRKPLIVAVSDDPTPQERRWLVREYGIFGYGAKPVTAQAIAMLVKQVEGLAMYLVRDPDVDWEEAVRRVGREPEEVGR